MYKLLLVDDEQIIREGLARMIDWEGLGLTLTASCSNALAALDSMTDDMPDILLADVRMPGPWTAWNWWSGPWRCIRSCRLSSSPGTIPFSTPSRPSKPG